MRRKSNTWEAKAKRKKRRGQKEAGGMRDELERKRERDPARVACVDGGIVRARNVLE